MDHSIIIDYQDLERIKKLASQYEQEEGFNPFAFYCSHSGRQLGMMNDDTIRTIIHTIRKGHKDIGDDHLIVEALNRCMLSARPSPAWMMQNKQTLQQLILSDPIGCATRYLCTAIEPTTKHLQRVDAFSKAGASMNRWSTLETGIQMRMLRIKIFWSLNKLAPKQIEKLVILLLECDARIGLHNMRPPKDVSLDTILDGSLPIDTISKHYRGELSELMEEQRIHARQHTNSLSTAAFFPTYVSRITKYESAKTVERRKKKAESDKMNDEFDRLLADIEMNRIERVEPEQPKKPTRVRTISLKKK